MPASPRYIHAYQNIVEHDSLLPPLIPLSFTVQSTTPFAIIRFTMHLRSRNASARVGQTAYTHNIEQASGFFTLSAELRNMIYEHLSLEKRNALWNTAETKGSVRNIGPSATPPPISQVCRLIRSETLSIYYGLNNFSISLMPERNVGMAQRWISAIGTEGVSRLRNFRIRGYAWGPWREYSWVDDSGHTTFTRSFHSSNISMTVQRQVRPQQIPRHRRDDIDAAPGAAFSVVPEESVLDDSFAPLAPLLSQVLTATAVRRFQCVVELFASCCMFRTEEPPVISARSAEYRNPS